MILFALGWGSGHYGVTSTLSLLQTRRHELLQSIFEDSRLDKKKRKGLSRHPLILGKKSSQMNGRKSMLGVDKRKQTRKSRDPPMVQRLLSMSLLPPSLPPMFVVCMRARVRVLIKKKCVCFWQSSGRRRQTAFTQELFFVGAHPRLDYKPPVVRLYSRGFRSLNVVTADTNRDPAPRLSLKSPWLSQFMQFRLNFPDFVSLYFVLMRAPICASTYLGQLPWTQEELSHVLLL